MSRIRIPGLFYVPIDESNDADSFQCIGFDLKTFTVPGVFKYGNCRPINEFEKLETIARGGFGSVYKVRDTKSNEIYALKRLQMPKDEEESSEMPGSLQVMPQKFLRYINNLKTIKHLNIVNLKEVVVGKNFESNYLVLDYCEYSLENIIYEVDAVFLQHAQIKNIMLQLLSGLQFIHEYNIIHRDLCPKNILFTDEGILKISDFGSSRASSDVDMTPAHALRWYRAPETLFGSLKYTEAVDIWAVGCIFAEMIRQKPLFHGNADGDIVRSMLSILGSPNEKIWPGYSDLPVPKYYHLKRHPYDRVRATFNNQTIATVHYLQKFLKYNPATRPSAEEVMDDPYYQEYPHNCPNHMLMVTLRMSKKL